MTRKLSAYSSAMLLFSTGLVAAPAAWADSVYVESNRGDANSLLAYTLGRDGSLQAKTAVATAGKGVVDPTLALGPFDSDQQIIMNSTHTLMLAVNVGSNSIAVFHIAANGDLTPAAGSPFNSHGIGPVSLGLHGDVLTVVNQHGDPAQAGDSSLPNYTTFRLAANGTLAWSGSTAEVAKGSSPSQALISPFAPVVIGADFLGGILRSFGLGAQGEIYPVSAQGIPAIAYGDATTPRFPLGLAANPHAPLVYVGLPTTNKIAVYGYDRFGQLKFLKAIADSGSVVCWLRTNREGTRLYASNTADPSITVYDIATDPRTPHELQKVGLTSKGGAYQLALSADEKHLLVITQRFQATTPQGQGNEIHVLAVDPAQGTVTENLNATVNLDLPTDVRPQGLVIF